MKGYVNTSESRSSVKQPNPVDIDGFIPWLFKELQSEQAVVVKKVQQEEFVKNNSPRSMTSRVSIKWKPSVNTYTADSEKSVLEDSIKLTVYLNAAGRVVEIAINDFPNPINSQLIETISHSIPFHPMLKKITGKGRGLNYKVIHGLAKMLPYSNLTDVCIDNSFVPEGNYYTLLDQGSRLNCLSLSKCWINDEVCMKIAERLEFGSPASKSLRVLCLSLNSITDIGARALGRSLRTNRHILHINLCSNNITSAGVGYLLEPLSEFPLNSHEVKARFRSRWEYFTKQMIAMKSLQSTSIDFSNNSANNLERDSLKKKSRSKSDKSVISTEQKITEDYVFGFSNTVYKKDRWFAEGNLVLSSLNLSYNHLDYTSLSKIIHVLTYQGEQERRPGRTGLLRIVIEGNNLPVECAEYRTIENFLISSKNKFQSFTRKKSSGTSRRSRHNNTDERSSV